MYTMVVIVQHITKDTSMYYYVDSSFYINVYWNLLFQLT